MSAQNDSTEPSEDEPTAWQPSRNPLFRVPDLLPEDTEASFLARLRAYKLHTYTRIGVLVLLIATPIITAFYPSEGRYLLAVILFGSAIVVGISVEYANRWKTLERHSNIAAVVVTIAFLIPSALGTILDSSQERGHALIVSFLASCTFCLSRRWFFLHCTAFIAAWLVAWHFAGIQLGPGATIHCFIMAPFIGYIMCATHVENLRRDFHMQKQNQRKQVNLQNTLTQLTSETERRKKEEALRSESERRVNEQQDQLFHVGRLSAMGEMVAGIAHEIHQPLQAVSTYCGVLEAATEKDQIPSSIRKVSTKIVNQVQSIAEIIRRLQNFTRKSESQASRVDIHTLIIDALELTNTEFTRHKIRTEMRLNAQQNETVVDPVQIQQVLVNLLRNACEAMHETPPEDRVAIITTDSDAENIAISICDAGHGFAADTPLMFEAFFSTKPDGLGIGLALSRTIIEKHDGKLSVSANENSGLTFMIELPQTIAAATSEAE